VRGCFILFLPSNPAGERGTVRSSSARAYHIHSLQRGLSLLNLFAGAGSTLSFAEVAGLSGLPPSTLHRFLVNLESAGYLSCDDGGNYRLGVSCVFLGQAAIGSLDVRFLGRPYLEELNRRTRETIHLTVRIGASAVYVEKIDSPEQLRIHSRIGSSVPLHSTAVGKILLAYLPASEQAALLERLELKRFTENTVRSQQELQAELLRVRKNGYACDLEEHEPHVRCVAAPIWDHAGTIHASLSVTGPAVRLTVSRLRELAPLVQEAGLAISRDLGFRRPGKLVRTSKSEKREPAGLRRSRERERQAAQE
jgi:DNA-binding IclR family transcriptional regulator